MRVRNTLAQNNLQGLPAVSPENLPLLLGFQVAIDPDGSAKKMDGIHLRAFRQPNKDGALDIIPDVATLRDCLETMQTVYATVAGERDDKDGPWTTMFNQLITTITYTGPGSIRHLGINFLVYRTMLHIAHWAQVFHNPDHLHATPQQFKSACATALQLHRSDWLNAWLTEDKKLIPAQRQPKTTHPKNTQPPYNNPRKHPRERQQTRREERPRTSRYRPEERREDTRYRDRDDKRRDNGDDRRRDDDDRRRSCTEPRTRDDNPRQPICISHILHQKDATNPACRYGAQCRNSHVTLRNGKLPAADKTALLHTVKSNHIRAIIEGL
jgi:hypothetical protein